jgi:cytochrome b subunit of formate dehydrogenase
MIIFLVFVTVIIIIVVIIITGVIIININHLFSAVKATVKSFLVAHCTAGKLLLPPYFPYSY